MLLVEVLKTSAKKSARWKMSLFLVIIYSSFYGYILSGDLGLLKDEHIVSSDAILVFAFISIAVGII